MIFQITTTLSEPPEANLLPSKLKSTQFTCSLCPFNDSIKSPFSALYNKTLFPTATMILDPSLYDN